MNTQKKMISAIMPTYNRQEFLKNAIQDVINQTYENWELMIVDDASTDDTEQIVRNAQEIDTRIKYIKLHKNSGSVCIPRAIGIINSTGEFIAHCDDDVGQSPVKFSVLVDALERNPSSDLSYGARIHNHPDDLQKWQVSGIEDYDPTKMWGVDNSQFIYRASVYKKIRIPFCKRGCDWETMKLIWQNNPGFVFRKTVVSKYEWHNKNRSLDETGTKGRIYTPLDYEEYFDGHENYQIDLRNF